MPPAMLLVVGIALLSGFVVNPAQGAEKSPAQKDPLRAAIANKNPDLAKQQGLKLFQTYCFTCHGKGGYGDGPAAAALPTTKPRNFHAEKLKYGAKPSDIVNTIYQGRSGGLMPPWKGTLEPQQVWMLAYLIHSWLKPEYREQDKPETLQNWQPPK